MYVKEYSGWVLDDNCKTMSWYTTIFNFNMLFCIHFHILYINNSHILISATYISSRIEKNKAIYKNYLHFLQK